MPRPREFDIDHLLDAAMRLFWRNGYAATSMSDVYAATDLKPGNIYGAVRNKEELFRMAFERYAASFRESLPKDAVGLGAIRAWLEMQVSIASRDTERKGCLIVNTMLERHLHSQATRAMAQERLQEIRGYFLRHAARAVADGEIAADTDLDAAADALTGTVVAIMSLGRAGAEAGALRNVAESALRALGPPPASGKVRRK
jgi:TetR/AcrR family transcriptional regulator, transcriptional repressor for nem operon